MSEKIVQQWLKDAARSANEKNLDAHMALISKHASLVGIPGFEHMDYEDWQNQCKYEFENNLLKSICYEGLKLITVTNTRIMFKTFETVEGTDGTINAQGIEVLLEKEEDEQWRLVQERVLPDEESRHDGLLP